MLARGERNGARVTQSRLLNSRQRSATLKQLVDERSFLSGRGVFVDLNIVRVRHSRSNAHHALRIETELHVEQIPKTAEKKRGRSHEDEGERKFRNDQQAPRPRPFSR